jgi:hypothetical protein
MTATTRPLRRPLHRVSAALVGSALLALLAATVPAFAGESAEAAPSGAPGWVRLAHLSPDTKAVDVRVTALGQGSPVVTLRDVAYGAVSDYAQLADGVYTVTMVPAGAKATATPVLSASLDVTAGTARTVAAFGSNKKLEVQSFSDDLSTPAPGTARVRLIQASTKAKTVDVATTTGMPIATGAKAGTATAYAAVAAGPWTLKLTGAKGTGARGTASVDLADGSISTLLVLDTPQGLTIRPVLDSAAVGQTPIGGVNTGGGWLATHLDHEPLAGLSAG